MKIKEILNQIRHFEATGKVHDSLIPYFNQHGKWCGVKVRILRLTTDLTHGKIKKYTLPIARRTSHTKYGVILKTSYTAESDDEITLSYVGIEGSLVVNGDALIRASELRHVDGHFLADSTRKIYLPKLRTVGGFFDVCSSLMLVARQLREVRGDVLMVGRLPPLLRTIGGRCVVNHAPTLVAPHLKTIGKSLLLPKTEKVFLNNLESVGSELILPIAQRIEARALRQVGSNFLAAQAETIVMPSLRVIGEDINSKSAKQFYNPKIKVGGSWTICEGAINDWIVRTLVRDALRGGNPDLLL